MVFVELWGLFQSDEGGGSHLRCGCTGTGGKEGELDPAFLWRGNRRLPLTDG